MPRTTTNVVLFAVVICLIGFGAIVVGRLDNGAAGFGAARGKGPTLEDISFNGRRAYEHLKMICAIGPRISGTPGMLKQRKLLREHFEQLGGRVSEPEFTVRHPQTGEPTTLANLIVEWHPDRKERILLCAHYDTRPYPDQDRNPAKRREPFLGANDGASGTALLMEMGTHMADYKGPLGVDFVLFDAEELVYDGDRDKYFLGSEHFAKQYVAEPPSHKYRCGVLFDMVADADLQIFMEQASMRYARPVTLSIWDTAKRLKVGEFIRRSRHDVRDDHLPLNQIAKIPTCDVIDFDYPRPGGESYWHTTRDVPENCSAESLAKVGWVIREWLEGQK